MGVRYLALRCQFHPMARKRNALRIVLPHGEWIDMQREKVKRTLPVAGTTDRVVLFSWSANSEPRNRNIARVDRHGNVVWRAELPESANSDCFNGLAPDGAGFVLHTFSGRSIRVDAGGRVVRAEAESEAA